MYGEHRDVVFLTEVAGGLRDRFGREAVREKGPCTLETVELAFFAAGFGDAIGVEGQPSQNNESLTSRNEKWRRFRGRASPRGDALPRKAVRGQVGISGEACL